MKKSRMLLHMAACGEITPRRLYNAAKCFLAMKAGKLEVPGYPSIMMVEPTNFCNLQCPLCLVPGTMIQCNPDIKPIEYVEKGNLVISEGGAPTEVNEKFERHYEGDMVEIKPWYLPALRLTPNHNVYVFNKSDNSIEKKNANSINEGDILVVPKPKSRKEIVKINTFSILKDMGMTLKPIQKDKFNREAYEKIKKLKSDGAKSHYIAKIYDTSGSAIRNLLCEVNKVGEETYFSQERRPKTLRKENGRLRFAGDHTTLPEEIELNDDFSYILGLFSAEGHINKPSKRPASMEMVFSFGKHEKELIDRTCRIMSGIFGSEACIQNTYTGVQLVFYSSPVASLFYVLSGGMGSNKKTIPAAIMESGRESKLAFLRGLIDGDGHINSKDHVLNITTVSINKANALMSMMLSLGWLPRFYERKPKQSVFNGRFIKGGPCYSVNVTSSQFKKAMKELYGKDISFKRKEREFSMEDGKSFFVPVQKTKTFPYSGIVHNVNVAKTHNYTANFVLVANCPTGNGTLKIPRGNMTFQNFKKIIDECGPYLLNLTLWNWGEPFLNKDTYDMIEYAKSKKIFVRVSTNGHLLKDAKNIERVVLSGMDELIFSLDGASKETFMKYRKSGDFDVVMDNLKKLVETKKRLRSRSPFVEIQFIVMRHNEHEIPKIRQLAKEIGVDALKLKSVNLEMEVRGQKEKNMKYLPKDEKYSRYTKDARKKHVAGAGCTRLWMSSVVNWDGSVSPCCYDPNRMFDLGNVFRNGSFGNAWNNAKYRALRKAVKENKSAILMCRECSGKLMGLDVE